MGAHPLIYLTVPWKAQKHDVDKVPQIVNKFSKQYIN